MNKKFILVLLFGILLLGGVSAFDFDNVKEYNPIAKEVTVKNCDIWLGVCLNEGEVLGKVKLLSELNEEVGVGYVKVWEKEFDTTTLIKDAIGIEEYYNIKDGMKPIEVEMDIKYKVITPTTTETCTQNNKTGIDDCIKTTYDSYTWEDYNTKDLPKGKIILSGWTTTEEGDNIEHIPTYHGKTIDEWSSWTAGLNTNLVSYYKLDGNSFVDSVGTADLTNFDTVNGTGKIKDSRVFTTDFMERANTGLTGTQARTFQLWVYSTDVSNYRDMINYGDESSGALFHFRQNNDGTIYIQNQAQGFSTNTSIVINTWTMVTFTWDGTEARIYQDGVLTGLGNIAFNTGTSVPIHIGVYQDEAQSFWAGSIDEVGIWSRAITLTEITQLYNDGTGISWIDVFNEVPSVVLNSPANDTTQTTSLITLNTTVTDNAQVDNVTLYIDGVLNETNSSGFNGTYIFTKYLTEGNHNWSILAYDNESASNQSETRTITIDRTSPIINITNPIGNQGYITSGNNLTFNWTASDAGVGLDTCWYTFKGINKTVTCSNLYDNITITSILDNNITFYVNDTLGNEASDTQTFLVNLLENSLTYDSIVSVGGTTSLNLNLSSDGSQSVTATLNYNGTSYATSKVGSDSEMTFAISITNTVAGIKTFYWNISYDGTYYQSASNNQTVNDINLTTDCGIGKTIVYNFTTQSEAAKQGLGIANNVTLEVETEIYAGSTLIESYSNNNSLSSISICVQNDSLTSFIYRVDTVIKYNADPYEPEYYYIQNFSLSNSSAIQNITLYDLLTASSQVFEVIVRDSSYLPISDALVSVKRKYINDGVFRIVERPQTDENGETVVHLDTNDVIYTFNITKFGEVIGLFQNVRPVCQNPTIDDCSIDFDAFQSTITIPDYETEDNINFTLAFNKDSRTISSVYTILDSTSKTISLNVTKEDALGTSVCTDILTSSSGTLSCVVPNTIGNATVVAKLYKDSVEVAKGNIKLDQDPKDIYGGDSIMFISLFVLLTIIGASISDNPVYSALFLGLGMILMFSLNLVANTGFIGATATILYLLIAIVLIVIKGSRRN